MRAEALDVDLFDHRVPLVMLGDAVAVDVPGF
jgi:hypothetical protein